MCTFPTMGVFRDVWPTWMASYPRVVLAEGSMDMMRLAYADPDLAQRAILTMFRDAYLPNVPCMHAEGQPNMIAADGSICGTSPAWCLPFTTSTSSTYVPWTRLGWSRSTRTSSASPNGGSPTAPTPRGMSTTSVPGRPVRTAPPGWTPKARAAPTFRASSARSRRRAPWRIAAMSWPSSLASSAEKDEARRWEERKADFVARTREMFDPEAGRFRDVDLRTGGFLDDSGPADYWDSNPKRYSVLSLTALILGVAAPEQTDAMRARDPALWPSSLVALALVELRRPGSGQRGGAPRFRR